MFQVAFIAVLEYFKYTGIQIYRYSDTGEYIQDNENAGETYYYYFLHVFGAVFND